MMGGRGLPWRGRRRRGRCWGRWSAAAAAGRRSPRRRTTRRRRRRRRRSPARAGRPSAPKSGPWLDRSASEMESFFGRDHQQVCFFLFSQPHAIHLQCSADRKSTIHSKPNNRSVTTQKKKRKNVMEKSTKNQRFTHSLTGCVRTDGPSFREWTRGSETTSFLLLFLLLLLLLHHHHHHHLLLLLMTSAAVTSRRLPRDRPARFFFPRRFRSQKKMVTTTLRVPSGCTMWFDWF